MVKKIDFKDLLTVDYAPGMDPLIKRNAKKRKGDETETSGPSEAVAPGGKAPPPLKPGQVQSYLDMGKHTDKLSGKNAMGWPSKMVKVKLMPDSKGKPTYTHIHAYEQFEELMDQFLDEAVLNAQQRRMRAMQFKRVHAKVQMGQKRAENRFADPKRLLNRAKVAARKAMLTRLTKGLTKDELSFQRRQEIEKRLDTPMMKRKIELLAIRMLPKKRQAEIQRHQQKANPNK